MIAAWQVRPPRLVTIADARLHDRLPIRVRHVGHQHLAGHELVHRLHRGQHPDRPGADPLSDRPTLDQDRLLLGIGLAHPVSLNRSGPHPGLHGLRPGLQDVQLTVQTVLAPLDVHRPAVMALDGHRLARQLGHLVIGQGEQPTLGLRDVHELGRLPDGPVGGVDHLSGLVADPSLQDRRPARRKRRLVDVELVRVHRPLHHRLPQPVRGGDEHRVIETRLGVHGEHHPRRPQIGADHLLHPGREGHRLVREGVVHPVGDRAVVVQRREHLPDRRQDGFDAAHVQERLLLTGERGVRQVLRRRTGPHREGPVALAGPLPTTVAAGQPLVRAADLGLQIRRERLRHHRLPDLFPRRSQRLHVVGVQSRQPGADPLRQTGVADEPAIGLRRRGEPVGHPHPQPGQVRDHLPQRRVLPAHLLQVRQAQLREPANVGRAIDRAVTGHG